MYQTTKALVLRATPYRDADVLLTLLTEREGKRTVKVRGGVRRGSRWSAAAQTLCFSELTMYDRGGKWILSEAEVLEQFLPLREDLSNLALGMYFAEAMELTADEDSPNSALLRLGLNSLYALSAALCPPRQVKAAFELRLSCLAGFAPRLDGEGELFSLSGGHLHAADRAPEVPGRSLPLDAGTLAAMRYIVSAEPKKLFSFRLSGPSERKLERICEGYLAAQLDREFGTLSYWKSLTPPEEIKVNGS